MKLLYEGDGEKHIIITDEDDCSIEDMYDYFCRLMLSCGHTNEEIETMADEPKDL